MVVDGWRDLSFRVQHGQAPQSRTRIEGPCDGTVHSTSKLSRQGLYKGIQIQVSRSRGRNVAKGGSFAVEVCARKAEVR